MPTVTVTVIKPFEYEGRQLAAGDPLELTEPVKALPLARQGFVSLARRYTTRAMQPEPDVVKPSRRRRKAVEGETEPTKRSYRRRDMAAEGE